MAIPSAVRAFESRRLLRFSLRLVLFCAAVSFCPASAHILSSLTATLQAEWSSAWHSHLLGLMEHLIRSLLHVFLNRNLGRPVFLWTLTSSPWRRSLGMRPASILLTWPIHLRRLSVRSALRLHMLSRSSTSVSGTLSYHLICSLRRRILTWKLLSFFSCLA